MFQFEGFQREETTIFSICGMELISVSIKGRILIFGFHSFLREFVYYFQDLSVLWSSNSTLSYLFNGKCIQSIHDCECPVT